MVDKKTEPKMPLTDKDSKALEEMFDKLEVEEISQIEALTAYFAVIPLEPWEETGWLINSSFPQLRNLPI
jgi:hypothetical protein